MERSYSFAASTGAHNAFFSGGGRLLHLIPQALRLPEALERRPEDLVKAVELALGPPATAAEVRVALPRMHLVPLLHQRAEGEASRLVVMAASRRAPLGHPSASNARHRNGSSVHVRVAKFSRRQRDFSPEGMICGRGER